jgi:hypothetical protein
MANTSRIAFSPLNHVVIAVGIPVPDFANGSYLNIKPNTDLANYDVGANGDIHVNLVANNTATATLRVGYDSPTYKLLRAAAVTFQTTGVFLPFSSTNTQDALDTTFSLNSNITAHSEDIYSSNAADMYRTYNILLHNPIRV